MSSGEVWAGGSGRVLVYRTLSFVLLVLQGAVLDFYLISFTDPSWCSWIATDLVVVSGWAGFFLKNSRNRRERACGFHQKGSVPGRSLGEFSWSYLAWLIYVIACTPKVVLILETGILDLVALKVRFGLTGLKVAVLLSGPLLFCLINSIVLDPDGPSRYRAHCCFLGTCLDLLDGFALLEPVLGGQVQSGYLRYTVLVVYFVALAVPVVWLYELTEAELRYRWIWARFGTGLLVNWPLLVVRFFQVLVQQQPVSVFLFKNLFFLLTGLLDLLDRAAALRRYRLGRTEPARFSHCVSETDMCPRGF
ncbi:transmembrane protein 121B [Nematolebias whitei]|uniref:transmembrane protein 121B n=1 Tax=Nematolebias whitei TaxID=451745 RepID=UPI00189B72DE|nr:transmembrane protein 121B [Nematolebias whitei]